MSDPINDSIYLITDYGAIPASTLGDYSHATTNATAIVNAINAAKASTNPGGTVLVPTGIFYTNENIEFAPGFGQISLRGANWGSSQLTYVGNIPASNAFISIDSGVPSVEIADIQITADPGDGGSQAGLNGILLNGGDIHVDTVQISGFQGFGLSVEDEFPSGTCSNVTIVGSSLGSAGAIQVRQCNGVIRFKHVVASPYANASSSYGILMNPNNYTGSPNASQLVSGPQFDNCVFSHFGTGLAMAPGTTTNAGLTYIGTVGGCQFNGCVFDSCTLYGALLGADITGNQGVIRRTMFVNCRFSNAQTWDGFRIGDVQQGMMIDSVGLVGCRMLNNARDGVSVFAPAQNVQIVGCQILGNGTYGVIVSGWATGDTVSGVVVNSNQIAGTAAGYNVSNGIGVHLTNTGTISNVIVASNNLLGRVVKVVQDPPG